MDGGSLKKTALGMKELIMIFNVEHVVQIK